MAARGVKNRTIFVRDNLEVMRGMDSESVDLIYLDPPFNKKKQFQAPIGSQAEGASFKDWWVMDDIKAEWLHELAVKHPGIVALINAAGAAGHISNKPYLLYMAPRLMEMHRILKDTGSIYLHCDPTMSHYLRMLMDAVFGEENFCNEIIWYYKNASRGKRRFAKAHDVLFWFAKNEKLVVFNREDLLVPFDSGMTAWRYSRGGQKGKPAPKGKTPDVITMPSLNAMAKERVGYPTQKPLALLERIVCASSNEGDLILDPFCGCATTLVAAEKLKRRWIGIDVSEQAVNLVWKRMQNIFIDEQPLLLSRSDFHHRSDIPLRREEEKRSRNIKKLLYGEQSGHCNLCRKHFEIIHLELDHIIPKASGGPDADSNLQLLCGHCNRVKGRRSNAEARAKILSEWFGA